MAVGGQSLTLGSEEEADEVLAGLLQDGVELLVESTTRPPVSLPATSLFAHAEVSGDRGVERQVGSSAAESFTAAPVSGISVAEPSCTADYSITAPSPDSLPVLHSRLGPSPGSGSGVAPAASLEAEPVSARSSDSEGVGALTRGLLASTEVHAEQQLEQDSELAAGGREQIASCDIPQDELAERDEETCPWEA